MSARSTRKRRRNCSPGWQPSSRRIRCSARNSRAAAAWRTRKGLGTPGSGAPAFVVWRPPRLYSSKWPVTPARAGHVLISTEQETRLFHFTQTAGGAHFSDRIVMGFPPSVAGEGRHANLGVVFRTGRKSGSVPEPSAGHPLGMIAVLSLSPSENDHAVLAQTFRDSSLTLYPN